MNTQPIAFTRTFRPFRAVYLMVFVWSAVVSQPVAAQNWQAVYPNEHFEYQSTSNPDSTLSIYVDHEMGYDFYSNGRFMGILYETSCDPIVSNNCTEVCYKMKFPFLQRGLTYLPNGVVEFQYPDTFRVATLAALGDEWVFKSDESGFDIIAEITAVIDTTVLGEADSLKVISLDGVPAIYLTKNHGIMGWYVDGADFELTAIPGRNLNGNQLTTADIFNLEVGDVLAYWTYSHSWSNVNELSSYYSKAVSRIEITGVETTDTLITIQFERGYAFFSNNQPNPDPSSNVSGSGINIGEATIDLRRKTKITGIPTGMVDHNWLTQNSLLDPSLLPFAYPALTGNGGSGEVFVPLEVHTAEINGRKFFGHGIKEQFFPIPTMTEPSDLLNINPQLSDVGLFETLPGCTYTTPSDTSSLLYKYPVPYPGTFDAWIEEYYSFMEGLGITLVIIDYYGIGFYGSKSSILLGYEKNGIQVGYIPDLLELSTLNVADQDREDLIKVFPNPNNGQFTVALPDGIPFRSWSILDGAGRKHQFGHIPTSANQIDLELPLTAGIYLLSLETIEGKSYTKKLVIQ